MQTEDLSAEIPIAVNEIICDRYDHDSIDKPLNLIVNKVAQRCIEQVIDLTSGPLDLRMKI